MGCGSSGQQVSPEERKDDDDSNNNQHTDNIPNGTSHKSNGTVHHQPSPTTEPKRKVKDLGSHVKAKPPSGQDRQSVSFVVGLDDNNRIDSIISKHPPKRLKRLEPLENAPTLSPEALEERLRQAEEKRLQQLEAKKEVSRRSSRLRQGILQARELDKKHNQAQDALDEKLKSADRLKEAKRQEQEEKKRKRQERARQARERAQKMKDMDGDMDLDLERDDAFNAEDDESWLDGENNKKSPKKAEHADSAVSLGERIYSGRESPLKLHNHRGSDELHARMSASTTDSFDYAFQRKPVSDDIYQNKHATDDFFDS